MRVCVTGLAGFIGSHVADALIAEGHTVVGIDDLSTGTRENVNPEVDFYEIDIANYDQLLPVLKDVEVVFHLAALARIQPSIDSPLPAHWANLDGTVNLLEAMRKVRVKKIVFSGSSSIYDDKVLPLKEDSPTDPKNPYALQKRMCEEYIRLYHELYGMDYTIFRYFNVYGPRQVLTGAYAAVVGIFLEQQKEDKPLTVFGGKQRRDFTHVRDVVNANLMALDGLDNDTFNVGTGENISIQELADRISSDQTHFPQKKHESEATLADNSKLKSQGWEPTKFITRDNIEDLCSVF